MEATLVKPTIFGDVEGKVVWGSIDDASAFGDWNGASCELESIEIPQSASKFLPKEIEVFDLRPKVEIDVKKPGLVFQECFQDLGECKEDNSVATLSQLPHYSPAKPAQPSDTICGSASLWGRLLSQTNTPRLSEPKPILHSHGSLVSTLGMTPPHSVSDQRVPCSLRDHKTATKELSSSTTAVPLIQTKLQAPPCHGNPPTFLYQVSHHWLAQCTVRLQPQHCKKDLLQ